MFNQIPYARQNIGGSDYERVDRVLKSDFLTIGPEVEAFELELTNFVNAPTTVVSSGTAALHAAYFAIGIQPGDEVITPPITFIATQAMIHALGAKAVFVDVDANTGNIDTSKVEEAITPRTKAIVTVDYAGQTSDLDRLLDIARKNNVFLVEDAAHSIGTLYKGRKVGSIADVTTFSFFSTKNITTGEGGAISSPNKELIERARRFTHQGLVRDQESFKIRGEGPWHQEVHEFGVNYRLPDILCALGSSQLKKIEEFKKRRSEIFDFYNSRLAENDQIKLPTKSTFNDPMWHLYPIQVNPNARLEIFNFLRRNGVLVQVNYLPAYRHPVFGLTIEDFAKYPGAEEFYSREISLPMNTYIGDSELEYVADKVLEAVSMYGSSPTLN